MKKISQTQLLNRIKSDPYFIAEDHIFESVKEKLGPQPEQLPVIKHRDKAIFRAGIGLAACVIIGVAAVYAVPRLVPHKQNLAPAIGGTVAGTVNGGQNAGAQGGALSNSPAMFAYYQYKNGYYKVEYPGENTSSQVNADYKNIQGKIVCCLGGNVYEIAGYDPSKNVAVFNGRYYYKADYAFATSVNFGGSNYALTPTEQPDGSFNPKTGKTELSLGAPLGLAGPYQAYSLPGIDRSEKIAIELDKSTNSYCIAYQMPTRVNFNGRDYYLGAQGIGYSSVEGLKYLGKAGTYDIYLSPNASEAEQVIVRLGSKQAAAVAYTPSTGKPPVSWYGGQQESMYPVWANIELNDIVYVISSSFDYNKNQKELTDQLGSKLGDCTIGKYTYGIYAIKGTDPKISVAVKNNQMYLKYDFQFSAEVKYNGADYLVIQDFNGKVGGRIGTTEDGHEVDSVVGVDPQKEIIVILGGGTRHAVRK